MSKQRTLSIAGFLLTFLWLGGCATPPPADPDAVTRQRLVNVAEQLIGTPYVFGGTSKSGMDCSGLVQYTYRQVGLRIPRTTREQFRAGQSAANLLPGDLLFFRTGEGDEISHVGLYVGQNQMIHAASSTQQVKKVSLKTRYWQQRLVGAITFLKTATTQSSVPRPRVMVSEPNG